MPDHRSLLPALVAVAATVATVPVVPATADPGRGTGAPAVSRAATKPRPPAEDDDPLRLTIDTLAPSVVPTRGRVTITGTLTNASGETWTDVNVYPLTSVGIPMTSAAELDAAAAADDDLVVGERILTVADRIDELAPGEVTRYRLRVPRTLLPTTEGVHWLGVHALGATSEGRDGLADGKARTFLPLVGDDVDPLPTALVLQLRRRIAYAADGRVDEPARWARDLALGGRLRNVVEMGVAAGDRDITWVLDPALFIAVNTLVAGNATRLPPRPEPDEVDPDEPEESPGPGATGSPTDGSTFEPTDEALTDPTDPVALAQVAVEGQDWLARLETALTGQQVLTLPYGDVDSSAASHLDPDLLTKAQSASAATGSAVGLTSTPVLSSPRGFLNLDAVRGADPDTTVLVTDEAVPAGSPTRLDLAGHEVLLSSAGAVAGGPGPDDPLATVAVRQRILSEAAVRALDEDDPQPLVVALPPDWTASDPEDFFEGLDVDFVDLRPVTALAAGAGSPLPEDEYDYPAFQQEYELDEAVFSAARDLEASGGTLQDVLPDNDAVAGAVTREALASTSYWNRARATEARAATGRSLAWIRGALGRVTIDGPPSVTLSSATGEFPATLRNGLDERVIVRVAADATGGMTVELPDDVELDPGESTRLRLSATTRTVGTHAVRLYVTSVSGAPLGSSAQLPIRSNQVSQIIWIVIVAGGALLFGAIAVRLFRRVRQARTSG